jgi:hypothetical protein
MAKTTRGYRFKQQISKEYELDAKEVVVLDELAALLDLIDELREAISADGVTAMGSQGQPRPHPCLSDLSRAQALVPTLIRALGLPVENAVQQAPSMPRRISG